VVTATLDLLFQHGQRIDKIIILHTTSPISSISSAVDILQGAFTQPPYLDKVQVTFAQLHKEDGSRLIDVATPEDALAGFRIIYKLIKSKKKEGFRINLSISGGRKTLALYGLTAAQLLFDQDDRLWYLFSSGDFLASKRLHPAPGDEVTLVNIPVILWSKVSPAVAELSEVDDPFMAIRRIEELQLKEKYEAARTFILGSLTPAERKVVEILVKEGVSDHEIGERLFLSHRTVEQHLRSAYLKAADHWETENITRSQLITLLQYFYVTQIRENPHDTIN